MSQLHHWSFLEYIFSKLVLNFVKKTLQLLVSDQTKTTDNREMMPSPFQGSACHSFYDKLDRYIKLSGRLITSNRKHRKTKI